MHHPKSNINKYINIYIYTPVHVLDALFNIVSTTFFVALLSSYVNDKIDDCNNKIIES